MIVYNKDMLFLAAKGRQNGDIKKDKLFKMTLNVAVEKLIYYDKYINSI